MRGATRHSSVATSYVFDFYSHAPCGARRSRPEGVDHENAISTHTPHAGRDLFRLRMLRKPVPISTHTPHAGRDLVGGVLIASYLRFLLTRPMRGATLRIM